MNHKNSPEIFESCDIIWLKKFEIKKNIASFEKINLKTYLQTSNI